MALLVVGLAVAGSLQAASRALAGQARATRHAEASSLAETRLSELGVLPVDSLAGLDEAGWRRRSLAGRSYRLRSSARRVPDAAHLWRATVDVAWEGGHLSLTTVFYRPPRGPGSGS